jgi:polyferredoxin
MWKNRRRMAALAQAVAILGLPFLRVDGESALRFDIPGLKLHIFGAVLWIDQFPLVLLGTRFCSQRVPRSSSGESGAAMPAPRP